ncbi:MAG: hypothetical protein ACT6SF_18690 [Hydrogenophaga sp.]|jgi:hypothetical protein|uniref:hypothetical protein n=1 Tax=Hydrogenophaga sp. TaxID=1904254 RepID=UPI0040358B8E
MPTTIPYSPSLVLGSIVHPAAMDNLLAMSAVQTPIDVAQDTLNSFISLKHSLTMTVDELLNMNINPKDLVAKIGEVDVQLDKAATAYATTRIEQELKMQPLRAKVQQVNASVESPIDYNRTVIKPIDLAGDSLKMDAQYFSFDENNQTAENTVDTIRKFISASGGVGGYQASAELADSAVKQINRQRQMHKVAGTLVLTANCTHKQASILAPLILDVDKAIRVWNQLFPDAKDKIKMEPPQMEAMAKEEGTVDEKSFSIISGATYGSSFVGMVHVLKTDSTETSQDMEVDEKVMQAKVEEDAWWHSSSGGLGEDDTVASDIKNLLSRQNISSHVTVLTSGVILGMTGVDVQTAVRAFAVSEGEGGTLAALAALTNENSAGTQSVQAMSEAARTGKELVDLKEATVTAVLSKLGELQGQQVRMLNIDSLLTAFDNYVERARAGGIGVPINYYLKPITRNQLAQMWMSKYYPGRYLAISGDDSASVAANPGGGEAQQ